MNNITLSFLMTSLAGLSTMIGTIFIFIKIKNKENILASALSFAAGVMICVSITDLIPESLTLLNNIYKSFPAILICLIFTVIGIIISISIDKYIPDVNENKTKDKALFKVGIISMLAIILHNIPEGIATFIATNSNISLGISLTLAIALHNIPEGISISLPIYYGTGSKVKSFAYTFISALSEPFGALIAYLFLAPFVNDKIMGILFAIIAGIMLHISFYELLPSSKRYNKKSLTFIFFIIGTVFMLAKFLF